MGLQLPQVDNYQLDIVILFQNNDNRVIINNSFPPFPSCNFFQSNLNEKNSEQRQMIGGINVHIHHHLRVILEISYTETQSRAGKRFTLKASSVMLLSQIEKKEKTDRRGVQH